jgi:hypothetical protein
LQVAQLPPLPLRLVVACGDCLPPPLLRPLVVVSGVPLLPLLPPPLAAVSGDRLLPLLLPLLVVAACRALRPLSGVALLLLLQHLVSEHVELEHCAHISAAPDVWHDMFVQYPRSLHFYSVCMGTSAMLTHTTSIER